MGVRIWDSTKSAFKDADFPKIHNGSVWRYSYGYSYNGSAWVKDWGFYPTLNDNSWEQISNASANGVASALWSVGDRKAITLNGTVGTLSLSNSTIYVYILGFNHNSSVEGTGISFGGFKDALTGVADICLVDDHVNTSAYDGSKWFNVNHWGVSSLPYNTSYGGWAACDMRYDILGSTDVAPSSYGSMKTASVTGSNPTSTCTSNPVQNTLMSALPSDLRAVMKPITKYTDNKGGSTSSSGNVTASIDYLPLMAEYEIGGATYRANAYEKNKQLQYTYFQNGNSTVKYMHNSTSTTSFWWERSPCENSDTSFCVVRLDGSLDAGHTRFSEGLAPVFLV